MKVIRKEIDTPPACNTIFVSKLPAAARVLSGLGFTTPQQRDARRGKGRNFLIFWRGSVKMWLVASPNQMGRLPSRLRPRVPTTERYPAVSHWITGP